jgi:ketosteroid isomerase-like protein
VTVEFRTVIAEATTVVVEERMRAILANGGSYDNDYCFVFELEGNLIRRVREYMDTRRAGEMFGDTWVVGSPAGLASDHAQARCP